MRKSWRKVKKETEKERKVKVGHLSGGANSGGPAALVGLYELWSVMYFKKNKKTKHQHPWESFEQLYNTAE